MAVGWKELYGSPECRKYFFSLVLYQAIGLILILFFSGLLLRFAAVETDNRIYAAVGRLEKRYPGSASVAAPVFTKNADQELVSSGRALMAPYGYPDASFFRRSVIASHIPRLSLLLSALFIIFSGGRFILFFRFQSRIYSILSEYSECALSVLKGKTGTVTVRYDEGMLDLLATRFNAMVGKLEKTAELLLREKHFLHRIISDISHQLKTPMASLFVFNDLLTKDEGMVRADRRQFLELSRSQLNRMEWLVKSLLKIARLETGSIIFNKEALDIKNVLELAAGNY